MNILRIQGTTRVLGKAQGYLGLPVRDVTLRDDATGRETHAFQSAHEPTTSELERLILGAPVVLTILGEGHPPCILEAGEPPAALPENARRVRVANVLRELVRASGGESAEMDILTAVRALETIR